MRRLPAAVALVLIALAAAWWWWRPAGGDGEASDGEPTTSAPAVDPAHPDPADEGRTVSLTGELSISGAPRDDQLGVTARAALLHRDVAMFQWRERCEGDDCRYDTSWEDGAIDSRAFRDADAHRNPTGQPFADAVFEADAVRIGALTVEPALLRTLPTQPLAVTLGQLPPNLAASFSVRDGALYSGDPDAPAVGDVRIRYRQLQAGTVTLTGIQRGTHLHPIP
ncbi:MAG: hypothetical protein DI564_01535 [Rhodanobacter denitrificans]|uniref:Uncharacterized protein n=1 Tax=Rhodanobacter denitrificans TaxID=666685 RepID=A0A2W5KTM0_9GAMM|nr:MAG: hypothetical protein DI564_01535 [Rhodanobacter denitrificans]